MTGYSIPSENVTPFSVSGKIVVITGASRDIGREAAVVLAAAGADLAILARNGEALDDLADDLRGDYGVRVATVCCDIAIQQQVVEAVAAVIRMFGRIDVAVVNAGIYTAGSFLDMDDHQMRAMIETNVFGSLFTLKEIGRQMCLQESGSIIALGSIYGHVGGAGSSIYCLTKAAVMHLVKTLAVEWGGKGVRLNSVCPGWISTDLNATYGQTPKVAEAALRKIPLRRFGKVHDVAPAILYLASDASSFVTGQEFVIDGGQTAQ